ncbi:unnamed protein product, partial [Musa banksii]
NTSLSLSLDTKPKPPVGSSYQQDPSSQDASSQPKWLGDGGGVGTTGKLTTR